MTASAIPSRDTVRDISPDRVLSRVEWVTETLRRHENPHDATDTRRRRRVDRAIADYLIFYANAVQFLQDNGLTTRVILPAGELPTKATTVRAGDLTEEGLRFYYFGIRAWMNRMDRARNKSRVAADVGFPAKRLARLRARIAEEARS